MAVDCRFKIFAFTVKPVFLKAHRHAHTHTHTHTGIMGRALKNANASSSPTPDRTNQSLGVGSGHQDPIKLLRRLHPAGGEELQGSREALLPGSSPTHLVAISKDTWTMIAGHQDGPNFRVIIWIIGFASRFLSFSGHFTDTDRCPF